MPRQEHEDHNKYFPRTKARYERDDKLYEEAMRKGLDLPEEMGFNQNLRQSSGMGWKELAVIGAMLLGGTALWSSAGKAPAPVVPLPGPVDSEYEIRFFDADGNPIHVPSEAEFKRPDNP